LEELVVHWEKFQAQRYEEICQQTCLHSEHYLEVAETAAVVAVEDSHHHATVLQERVVAVVVSIVDLHLPQAESQAKWLYSLQVCVPGLMARKDWLSLLVSWVMLETLGQKIQPLMDSAQLAGVLPQPLDHLEPHSQIHGLDLRSRLHLQAHPQALVKLPMER